MKRILFIVSVICSLGTFAQSFDKGKIVVGLNYDLGVYTTEVYSRIADTTENDGAGSHIYTLSGEYGVLPWLGAGVKVGGASYITRPDSATGATPTSSSFDFALLVNAHLVRKEKFDLPVGVSFGGSSFKWKSNDSEEGMIKDFGTMFTIYTNPRFYFGEQKKFGFNLKVGYAMFSYNSLDISTKSDRETNAGSLKGKGVNLGAGFQMMF